MMFGTDFIGIRSSIMRIARRDLVAFREDRQRRRDYVAAAAAVTHELFCSRWPVLAYERRDQRDCRQVVYFALPSSTSYEVGQLIVDEELRLNADNGIRPQAYKIKPLISGMSAGAGRRMRGVQSIFTARQYVAEELAVEVGAGRQHRLRCVRDARRRGGLLRHQLAAG